MRSELEIELNPRLIPAIREGTINGLVNAGKEIIALGSVLAPKDTGELARSGKVSVAGDNEVAVSFGEGLPDIRAVAQEYGTILQPAQPYFLPAIRSVDVTFFIRDAINKEA